MIQNAGMRIAILLAAFATQVPASARACSVASGYKVPTTLDLAQRADTILIGTVIGETKGDHDFDHQVRIRPTRLIKGRELPGEVSIFGYVERGRMRATRSDPRELRRVNPDALAGACVRQVYARGMKLVLFFERKDGELRFADYPFARVSEDVASDNALWVQAVRHYVGFSTLSSRNQVPAMTIQRDMLRKRGGRDALAIADDIDVELRGLR